MVDGQSFVIFKAHLVNVPVFFVLLRGESVKDGLAAFGHSALFGTPKRHYFPNFFLFWLSLLLLLSLAHKPGEQETCSPDDLFYLHYRVRELELKNEDLERKVKSLEKENESYETKLETATAELKKVKDELEETMRAMDEL